MLNPDWLWPHSPAGCQRARGPFWGDGLTQAPCGCALQTHSLGSSTHPWMVVFGADVAHDRRDPREGQWVRPGPGAQPRAVSAAADAILMPMALDGLKTSPFLTPLTEKGQKLFISLHLQAPCCSHLGGLCSLPGGSTSLWGLLGPREPCVVVAGWSGAGSTHKTLS